MTRKTVIITTLFVLLILAGGIVANYVPTKGLNAYAQIGDNGNVEIIADGALPETLMYAVFSSTTSHDSLYFYMDEKYPSYTPLVSQESAFRALETMLLERGVNPTYIDSESIVDVMGDYDASIIILSGSLPDTVFDKNSGSLFENWLSNGGTVFWVGPEIGSKRSTPEGVVDTGMSFIDCNYVFKGDSPLKGDECSDISLALSMFHDLCANSLKEDYPGSKVLGRVSPDGYSSISVVGDVLGKGRLYVFGGNLDYVSIKLVTSMSDVVASGVTEDSILLGYGKFSKMYGSEIKDTGIRAEIGDSVYIMKGAPFSSAGNLVLL